MAKLWGEPKAAINRERNRRIFEEQSRIIECDLYHQKRDKNKKLGIKSSILLVYVEEGKLAAWQALQEYNKKLSGQGFTLEMLEQWIGEYESRQPKKVEKDDGPDR